MAGGWEPGTSAVFAENVSWETRADVAARNSLQGNADS